MSEDGQLEILINPHPGYSASGGAPAPLESAQDALGSLGRALAASVTQMKETLKAVDEVEVQMQLELAGKARWVVVSLGATATIGVKLVWRNAKEKHV